MRDRPALPDEAVARAVEAGYGIEVASLEYRATGYDFAAWTYRVDAGGGAYLLKLRTEGRDARGLLLPRHLHERGVPCVVPPVPTAAGAVSVDAGGFVLALFPWVDGRTGASEDLSAGQWRELGVAARRLHELPLAEELRGVVPREPFVPERRDAIAPLRAAVAAGGEDPVTRAFAAVWGEHEETIRLLVERTDALGPRLARADLHHVLCHADLHTRNVLVDREGEVWIVDWDEAMLAPRERDLMFVVGGISRDLVAAADTEAFVRGYGETAIDALALAYYRSAWAVQDIASFGSSVALEPNLGQASRRTAADGFASLFEPGEIVELALETG